MEFIDNIIEQYNELFNDQEKNEPIISEIEAFAIYNGVIIKTLIYERENEVIDENESVMISKKQLLEFCEHKLYERMIELVDETKKAVLQEIHEKVKNNPDLVNMRLQKQRNEYANRIYSDLWDQGHEWIIRADFRRIVEFEYFHLVDNSDNTNK